MLAYITVFLSLFSPPTDSVALSMDRLLTSYHDLDRFSGTVMVYREGVPTFTEGYGLAQRSPNVANTASTAFDLGSVTKPYTALAVVHLAQNDRLDLHAPIGTYVPDAPAHWSAVTAHHLLSHTSGIPSLFQGDEVPETSVDQLSAFQAPIDRPKLIRLFRDLPLLHEPGTAYRYSNSGYVLLADIVERVTGQPVAAYLGTLLPSAATDIAVGYQGFGSPPEAAPAIHPTWTPGAGGLHRSAQDLAALETALRSNRVLDAHHTALLFAAHAPMGYDDAHYGYGWETGTKGHMAWHGHTGATPGFVSVYWRFPDEGLAVAVLMNRVHTTDALDRSTAWAQQIAQELTGIALGQPAAPLDVIVVPNLAHSTGTYSLSPDHTFSVEAHADALHLRLPEESAWSLHTYAQQHAAPSGPLADQAALFFEALTTEAFADAAVLFSPTMQTQVSAEQLAGLWQSVTSQTGPPQNHHTYFVDPQASSALVRVAFAPVAFDFRLVFDEAKQVAGFFMEGTDERQPPTRYRLYPLADGRFLLDGFSHGLDDLYLTFDTDTTGHASHVHFTAAGTHTATKR